MGTSIVDSVGSNSAFSQTVENPFQTTHTALRGLSSASVTYDFAWTGDDAHFDLFATHHLEELRGTTSSSGRIVLRPMVDSFVTFSGTWEYAWPSSALGSTNFSMRVWDLETETVIAVAADSGGNVGVGPPFGSFDLSGSTIIAAGRDYMLTYRALIDHFDPTPPGTFGTGAGQLNFTITPVPEPAALAMLVLPMFLLRRAKRSRA